MRRNTDIPAIPEVVEGTTCSVHYAGIGVPCHKIITVAGDVLPAICNSRAIKFGFNAPVSPKSLSRKRF